MGKFLDSIGNSISSIVEPVGDAASSVIEPVMDVAEPYVPTAFEMLGKYIIGGQIGAGLDQAFGGTTPTMDSWSGGDYSGGDYSGGYGGGDGIDYGETEPMQTRSLPVGVGQTTSSGIPDPYAGSTPAAQAAELQSAYGGAGISDPYAASTLTGQAADLMSAYGGGGNSNPFSKALSGIGNFFSNPNIGKPSNALSIGSGLYGLYQSDQMRKMAQMASQKADPWGQSGGRAMAGGRLQNLLNDPSSITSMPGYNAGLQAVQRSMAAQGYQGSGNMMAALQQYGGGFYDKAVNQLSGLSGATQNPAESGRLLLQGTGLANDASSRAQASIGYGLGGGMNPAVLAALQKIGAMQT